MMMMVVMMRGRPGFCAYAVSWCLPCYVGRDVAIASQQAPGRLGRSAGRSAAVDGAAAVRLRARVRDATLFRPDVHVCMYEVMLTVCIRVRTVVYCTVPCKLCISQRTG